MVNPVVATSPDVAGAPFEFIFTLPPKLALPAPVIVKAFVSKELEFDVLNISDCPVLLWSIYAVPALLNLKLFSSILNVYEDNKYFSLFYDIEKYFGSFGSVYYADFISGNYEATIPSDETMNIVSVNKILDSNFLC